MHQLAASITRAFDFFFPLPRKTPRVEAATWETQKGLHREFFTFRALLAHLWGEMRRFQFIPLSALQLSTTTGAFGYLFAIAYDAQAHSSFTTSFSFSHTCSGTDRGLLVGAVHDAHSGTPTYNSIATVNDPGTQSTAGMALFSVFHLINPASGSNTVDWSGTWSSGTRMRFAVSFSGVNQTAMLGATTIAENPNDDEHSAGNSVTTLYANSLVVDFFRENANNASPYSHSAGTKIFNVSSTGGGDDDGGGGDFYKCGSTYQTAPTPGGYGNTWSWTSPNSRWNHKVLEIRAPAEPSGGLLSFLAF